MDVHSPKNRVDDSSQIQSERLKELKMDGRAKVSRTSMLWTVHFHRHKSFTLCLYDAEPSTFTECKWMRFEIKSFELALNVTSFFRNSSILKSEAGFHDRSRAKLDTSILSKYMSTPPAGPEIIKIISWAISRHPETSAVPWNRNQSSPRTSQP